MFSGIFFFNFFEMINPRIKDSNVYPTVPRIISLLGKLSKMIISLANVIKKYSGLNKFIFVIMLVVVA